MLDLVQCGGILTGMDPILPRIISTVITAIMIGVPVLLVIFGMLDLGKAVMAQKEDEIKKGQQMFLKRLLSAAIVFFVIFLVQMLFSVLAASDSVTGCFDCFVRGPTRSEFCETYP